MRTVDSGPPRALSPRPLSGSRETNLGEGTPYDQEQTRGFGRGRARSRGLDRSSRRLLIVDPRFCVADTAPDARQLSAAVDEHHAPTEAQCIALAITCFTPQAIQSAYNVGPLYARGLNGKGMTIAIVDAYGSDTMAHDLHVFDQAFGLQPMCGEEGVACTASMPKFSELTLNGSPATKPQPGNGTHQEDKTAWALEVALDVETSHAIAPGANILLVHTPNAETLGVQGFPNMMKAEDYVVKNHLANVISQSFASAEDAFGSSQSLQNLRFAYKDAQANNVTVLGSSGDGGTANARKTPVSQGGSLIPFPTVEWPASDPLVTGVGGTYLCTDPFATTSEPRTKDPIPGVGAKCGNAFNPGGIYAEVAWTFSGGGYSDVFAKPSYQNTLPAGSSFTGTMRGVPAGKRSRTVRRPCGSLIVVTTPMGL